MSKKSRKRNRNLLKMAALAGGAALLAGRGKGIGTGTTVSDAQKITSQLGAKRPIRETVYPVTTKSTIMDSMPVKPKKNPLSTRVTDKGEVYTIKGVKEGTPKKIGNKKSIFTSGDYIYQDGKPYTKGRFGTFAARNKKPAMLGDNYYKAPVESPEFKTSDFDYFSKGGRVKKRTGAAKRGYGRAFKGGK